MKKRFLRLLMIFCITAGLLVQAPIGAGAETEGVYTYSVYNNEVTISQVSSEASGIVEIPETLGGYPVTRLDAYAFMNCSQVTEVIVPDSVVEISRAFTECGSLEKVTLGKGITTIPNMAFAYCWSLTSISFSDNLTRIGPNAFFACENLESIDLRKVVRIDYDAFNDCTGLKSIVFPDTLTTIGVGAFADCTNLETIVIGAGLCSIGRNTFVGCNVTSLTVDSRNTSFSAVDNVLYNKEKTQLIRCFAARTGEYIVPAGVTSIAQGAFLECNKLTAITLGKDVSELGAAFAAECAQLTAIHADSANPLYASEDGVLFTKDKTTLVAVPGARTGTFTVPDGVTAIGNEAFYGCSNLTEIILHDGITAIGSDAFAFCRGLTGITLPAIKIVSSYLFSSCTNLTEIRIPEGVEEIQDGAFMNCRSVKAVYLPESLETIGEMVFMYNSALQDVYYSGSQSQWQTLVRYLDGTTTDNESLYAATKHYNYREYEGEGFYVSTSEYTTSSNNNMNLTVAIANETAAAQETVVRMAMYNQRGVLLDITTLDTVTVSADGIQEVHGALSHTGDPETIKIFLWQPGDGLVTLGEKQAITL